MASGAERAARKRRFAAKVAAGAVPAPRVTHFQTADVRTAVQDELAAQHGVLAAQRALAIGRRERARFYGFQQQPPSGCCVIEGASGATVLGTGNERG